MNTEYLSYIQDQFQSLFPIRIRKMFGGAGVYFEDLMFGLIADNELYLKVNDSNRADYEAYDMGPFVYEAKGKPIALSYYKLPEEVLEDPIELREWAMKAVTVARHTKKA